MKLPYARPATLLLALAAVAALGACSRAQHVTDALNGPGRTGAGTQGAAGCPTLVANDINTAFNFNTEFGAVASFRPGIRLRIETVGDAAEISMLACGQCAANDIPTINFIGGHANVFLSGTSQSITTAGERLTFGRLAFLGTNIEPGIIIAFDSQGNVLEIIWPALAGLPPGPPRLRLQLARWSAWVQTGRKIDVRMTFNAAAANGSTATYTVSANDIMVPQAR